VMPVLIILDGANEREAWKAAENLLHDYDQHRERLFPHVRLLFTSRRLEHRPYGGANFWQSAELTRVGTFSSEEFRAALNRFAPDLSPEDLPSSIRDLALVPRYLRLCISLRERLNSISHVTKELLLWMDLEEKLANRDPQWVTIQTELYGSPQEILSRLARSAQWPADMHGTALPRAELLRELSGYDRVRHDLQEQRIFLSVDSSEALISADHLILGWALVLCCAARSGKCDRSVASRRSYRCFVKESPKPRPVAERSRNSMRLPLYGAGVNSSPRHSPPLRTSSSGPHRQATGQRFAISAFSPTQYGLDFFG